MIKKIIDWISRRTLIQRLNRHIKEFKYIWILLLIVMFMCLLLSYNVVQWPSYNTIIRILLGVIAALFLLRPMNAVYGLMGTSGSIILFFFNFLIISLIFTCIYQFAFFKDAGISYDVNQPHIDYYMFSETNKEDSSIVNEIRDTMFLEHHTNRYSFKEMTIHTSTETLHYQKIDFMQVWRSTIMTTLIQEPTELFSIASVHNSSMKTDDIGSNKEKSVLFEWILIFQIFISWIFFGVFISLLYNKFRYES